MKLNLPTSGAILLSAHLVLGCNSKITPTETPENSNQKPPAVMVVIKDSANNVAAVLCRHTNGWLTRATGFDKFTKNSTAGFADSKLKEGGVNYTYDGTPLKISSQVKIEISDNRYQDPQYTSLKIYSEGSKEPNLEFISRGTQDMEYAIVPAEKRFIAGGLMDACEDIRVWNEKPVNFSIGSANNG